MQHLLDVLKKEWKVVLAIVWMVFITVYIMMIHAGIGALEARQAELRSTVGSMEGVIISTDSNIANINEKVRALEADVSYIVKRVKRR